MGKKGDGGEEKGREEKREGEVKRAEGRRERERGCAGRLETGTGAPQHSAQVQHSHYTPQPDL